MLLIIQFGLTYSAVSRRANIVKSEISKQSEMRLKDSLIKSMIKVTPLALMLISTPFFESEDQ